MPTQPSKQPNTEPSPHNVTAGEERRIAAAVAEFHSVLVSAACWRRKEIPPDSPLSFAWRFLPALLFVVLMNPC